ncbi:MAG: Zn-ribbon domain-containing OB-fold protein [Actinomycetales bacterium]|jgi:hypothetical protein
MPLFPVRRDAASAAFFDGTAEGKFLIVRDTSTGEFLDSKTDVALWSERYEYVAAAGTGEIVSWSVVHGRGSDGAPNRVVVGVVQLAEGPWWWGELDADPDADLTGAAVHVTFVPTGTGDRDETAPVWAVSAA